MSTSTQLLVLGNEADDSTNEYINSINITNNNLQHERFPTYISYDTISAISFKD